MKGRRSRRSTLVPEFARVSSSFAPDTKYERSATWKNIEAAKKAHGPAFEEAIQSIFGSKPEFQYFEAPIVIDNAAKEVVDSAA